jgi:hypothetical protein
MMAGGYGLLKRAWLRDSRWAHSVTPLRDVTGPYMAPVTSVTLVALKSVTSVTPVTPVTHDKFAWLRHV